MGFNWWTREWRLTRAEAKGGRPSPLSQQHFISRTEKTLFLLCLLCFLLQTKTNAVYIQQSERKKIYIGFFQYLLLKKMPEENFLLLYNCISIAWKSCLQAV